MDILHSIQPQKCPFFSCFLHFFVSLSFSFILVFTFLINDSLNKVSFSPDFPGLKLENFVSEELNTSITVLHGRVKVETNNENYTLGKDDEMKLPANETHVVYTVSDTPACWMYVYLNTTVMKNETLKQWITDPGGFLCTATAALLLLLLLLLLL